MKDMLHTAPRAAQEIETMSLQALKAHKDSLLQQIETDVTREDTLWGEVARVNAYIRAASEIESAA